jgi:hypothetical protein
MNKDYLISKIIELEWAFFQATQNIDGRADCQDDKKTFEIMRTAQAKIWSENTLESYLSDLKNAMEEGENPVAFKYGYMMEETYPDEFQKIKHMLPDISTYKQELVEKICSIHGKWTYEAYNKYPNLISRGRPITSKAAQGGKWAAVDNYLKSELMTYSEGTLLLCLYDTEAAYNNGENLTVSILKNTAEAYGYGSIEEVEDRISRNKKPAE